jgi:Xaa-Pro aminopeptidase
MSHLTDRHHDRLQRAQRLTGERAVAALWVEPSVGLAYLTGLDLVGLERPTGLVIPAEGALRMVVPLLLRDECEAVGAEMEVWDDAGGPTGAIRAALEGISRLHVQGSLPASHLFALKSALPDLQVELDPGVIGSLRERKDADEVSALKRAGKAADDVVSWIGGLDLGSLTERQLALEIQRRFLELGYKPSPYGLVASGSNAAMPHYVGTDVAVDTGRVLLLDLGWAVEGYWSDVTRMYFPSDLDSEIEEAYGIVCDAYDAAFSVLEPGVPCKEIDRAAREVIEKAGYGDNFLHRTGHGLGMEVHEPPYLTGTNEQRLEVGHVFSIEPGIYVAGRFGVRYENILYLGEEGPESMNSSPRKHFFGS